MLMDHYTAPVWHFILGCVCMLVWTCVRVYVCVRVCACVCVCVCVAIYFWMVLMLMLPLCTYILKRRTPFFPPGAVGKVWESKGVDREISTGRLSCRRGKSVEWIHLWSYCSCRDQFISICFLGTFPNLEQPTDNRTRAYNMTPATIWPIPNASCVGRWWGLPFDSVVTGLTL